MPVESTTSPFSSSIVIATDCSGVSVFRLKVMYIPFQILIILFLTVSYNKILKNSFSFQFFKILFNFVGSLTFLSFAHA